MNSTVHHNGISGIESARNARIHRERNITSVWIQYCLSSSTVPCCGSKNPTNSLLESTADADILVKLSGIYGIHLLSATLFHQHFVLFPCLHLS